MLVLLNILTVGYIKGCSHYVSWEVYTKIISQIEICIKFQPVRMISLPKVLFRTLFIQSTERTYRSQRYNQFHNREIVFTLENAILPRFSWVCQKIRNLQYIYMYIYILLAFPDKVPRILKSTLHSNLSCLIQTYNT